MCLIVRARRPMTALCAPSLVRKPIGQPSAVALEEHLVIKGLCPGEEAAIPVGGEHGRVETERLVPGFGVENDEVRRIAHLDAVSGQVQGPGGVEIGRASCRERGGMWVGWA